MQQIDQLKQFQVLCQSSPVPRQFNQETKPMRRRWTEDLVIKDHSVNLLCISTSR
uniref:Uncharacterized protein n=1 Tax=Manihot esculenta TaxID=3983 RepID=A0A2C9WG03_MANES